MQSIPKVQLNRKFSPMHSSENDAEVENIQVLWGYKSHKNWIDLEGEYRTVILAEAGAGKTFEMLERAQDFHDQGKYSFFIRIEDIDSDFEHSFEVGGASEFDAWKSGVEEAWFFLDSVDEARLESPRSFEKRLRVFSKNIKGAEHRAHIFISSRPFAWRPKTDSELVRGLIPFSQGNESGTESAVSKSLPKVYLLRPLDEDDIREYANVREVPQIDNLVDEIRRLNLVSLAERPFDLELILDKWSRDLKLDNRLELFGYSIRERLKEGDPDRPKQPFSLEDALEGTRRIAASVMMSGLPGIRVPGGEIGEKREIIVEEVLPDWQHDSINGLLNYPIFNDVLFGMVRFRHREIRELLAAEWFGELLERGKSREYVESLFFRFQYGEWVVVPKLRPLLPWLILFDSKIRQRVYEIEPEIVMEGGDPSLLPISDRKSILKDVVARIASGVDSGSIRDNESITRIADPALTEDVSLLIQQYVDNDDVIFFLGRLVWQGKMFGCTDQLFSIAANPKRNIYSRIASVRAIVTLSSDEQRFEVWEAIQEEEQFPNRLLAELLDEAPIVERSIQLLIETIPKLSDIERYDSTGVKQAIQGFISRFDPYKDEQNGLLKALIFELKRFIDTPPYIEKKLCKVSERYRWLLGLQLEAVAQLISGDLEPCVDDEILGLLSKAPLTRDWTGEDLDEADTILSSTVPQNDNLNDTLFWMCVEQAREIEEQKDRQLKDVWRVQIQGHYWSFEEDSFERVLGFLSEREKIDDRYVALSLAVQLFVKRGSLDEDRKKLEKAISGESVLESYLSELINPKVHEERLVWEAEERQRRKKRAEKKQEEEKQHQLWIRELQSDPDRVRNPVKAKPGQMTHDQLWLLKALNGDGLIATRSERSDWEKLKEMFGDEVVSAFRDAAINHWKNFDPGIESEGANLMNPSYLHHFGLLGLKIESQVQKDFPSNLKKEELVHALRYFSWEINSIPIWVERIFKKDPQLVLDVVWKEIRFELEAQSEERDPFRVFQQVRYSAPWIHEQLSPLLLNWIESNEISSERCLDYMIAVFSAGNIDFDKFFTIVTANATKTDNNQLRPFWYAFWVAIDPESGIEAVSEWLSTLNKKDATFSAEKLIVILMGSHHSHTLPDIFRNHLSSAQCLKQLYILIHHHVSTSEDIKRKSGVGYSPTLRDDAQEARGRIFNVLADLRGKESYLAIQELIELQEGDGAKSWMMNCARRRAIADADLEDWTERQVYTFEQEMMLVPATHRQLYDLGRHRLVDLKNFLERGNESIYKGLQKAEDEAEVRNWVSWIMNERSQNLYQCAQEFELANGQRLDICFQANGVQTPVPIELKLLDQGWSGNDLCERLRNQLAGDYLRESSGGCGIMLLVFKGESPDRTWIIEGNKTGVDGLGKALSNYWESISQNYPNVESIEVLVIDLSIRAKISDS